MASQSRTHAPGRIWLLALMFLAVLPLLSPAPAAADPGVSLDRGGLFIVEKLSGGGSYTLPLLTVRNPGDERSAYRLDVTFLEDTHGHRPEAGWFAFEPATFALEPGARQPVQITLHIAADASPGDYEALVQAALVNTASGTAIGAAAAAPVTFTVEPSNTWEALQMRAGDLLDSVGTTGPAAAAGVVALAGLAAGARGIASRRRGQRTGGPEK